MGGFVSKCCAAPAHNTIDYPTEGVNITIKIQRHTERFNTELDPVEV
jgi:hypothetical protein